MSQTTLDNFLGTTEDTGSQSSTSTTTSGALSQQQSTPEIDKTEPEWLTPLAEHFEFIKKEVREEKKGRRTYYTLRCNICANGQSPSDRKFNDKGKNAYCKHLKVFLKITFHPALAGEIYDYN